MSKPQAIICPYCGETQAASDHCRACGGLFEPLSRQATHNEMGPWFIRSPARPFQPGCSYETLIKLLERGQVDRHTLLRGPSTKQFWTIAKRVPGVSHLLGFCHQCDAEVNPGDHGCPHCGVSFGAYLDRNHLGLPEIRPLPWEIDGTTADVGGAREQRNGGALRSERGGLTPQRGLSSFATDQELLGTTPPYAPDLAGPDFPAPLAPTAVLSRGFESRLPGLPGLASDRAVDSPTIRAMQTSLAQQRRTSRLLLAIIAALAIVLAIVLLRNAGSDAGSSGSGSAAPARVAEQAASPAAPSTPAAPSSPATTGAPPVVPLPSPSPSQMQPPSESPNHAQSQRAPSSLPSAPSGEPTAPPLSPSQPP